MSKLKELLKELCPNGVEYKKIGEIATISRGGNFQKKDYVEKGVPCIHYGQIYTKYNLFVDKTLNYISEEKAKKQKFAVKNDIIMAVTSENVDDVCKCIVWLGEENVAVSGHTAIIHHNIDPKYFVYYLHSSMFYKQKLKLAHGTKVIEVTPDKLTEVQLPVPPLEVQREIVHILDNFTFLSAELTAELTARKKQYEYYRNLLLTKDIKIKKASLRDIAKSYCSGGTPLKSHTEYYENGNIPWLRTQEVIFNEISRTECFITEEGLKNSSAKWISANCIIIAISGASAGRCAINKIPLTTNQHCLNIEIDETKALYKYVYYCICNQYNELQSRKEGTRGDLNINRILDLIIPVPSLEVQERLVKVLDNFENICSDLKIGLPAEIEARKKQYEFYRDKLLTFVETGNIIFTEHRTQNTEHICLN